MTIGLVMIARQEAAVIGRCLTSARAAGVVAWTVVDTGSTDDTLAVIESAMAGIPGTLYRRPWVNFGHNRTEAFALARGSADWLLALDADMTVEIDPDFEPDQAVAAYMIELGSGDFSYRLPLLIRGDLPWRSFGAVHEYTALDDRTLGLRAATDRVRITHHGENRSSPEKSRWHAELLAAELARDPDDARTVFYLAQTYRELGDRRAADLYWRRVALGGWDQERFYAAYQAALLESDWSTRATSLLAAWGMRPHRLEPLHALVQELNRRGQHRAAYALASMPQAQCEDVLFVHRSVWDWGLKFELSIAAWWVGKISGVSHVVRRALGEPEAPRRRSSRSRTQPQTRERHQGCPSRPIGGGMSSVGWSAGRCASVTSRQ